MIAIPNVTPQQLTELLSGLKDSGHGQVSPIDAASGAFVVSKKVAWVTLQAHGSYSLALDGTLSVTCDHYEDKVGEQLRESLASMGWRAA